MSVLLCCVFPFRTNDFCIKYQTSNAQWKASFNHLWWTVQIAFPFQTFSPKICLLKTFHRKLSPKSQHLPESEMPTENTSDLWKRESANYQEIYLIFLLNVCMFHQPRFTSFAQSKSKIICYGPFKPVLFSSLMTEKSVYQIYSPYLWYGTIQLVFFTPVASSWFPGHNRTWKQTNTPIKLYSGLLLIFFFRSWIIWPPKKPHVHTPTYMDLSINSFLQHN